MARPHLGIRTVTDELADTGGLAIHSSISYIPSCLHALISTISPVRILFFSLGYRLCSRYQLVPCSPPGLIQAFLDTSVSFLAPDGEYSTWHEEAPFLQRPLGLSSR